MELNLKIFDLSVKPIEQTGLNAKKSILHWMEWFLSTAHELIVQFIWCVLTKTLFIPIKANTLLNRNNSIWNL